tara:strand:- start:9119 stop:9541 length:423 start_codon:yes stop_codon:yes gene_type:complete
MLYAREYKQLTAKPPPKNMSISMVIEQGLPINAVDNMIKILGINKSCVANLLGVTPRSLQQLKKNAHPRLNNQLTDRALQLARLMNEITECFSSKEAAIKWMSTPNIGLGDETPLSLCNSFTGMEMVRNSVNRLKYGMTA